MGVVQEYQPFSRVVDSLKTLQGLSRVRAVYDQGTQLHGKSDKDVGIEEPGPQRGSGEALGQP